MKFYTNTLPLMGAYKKSKEGQVVKIEHFSDPVDEGTVFKIEAIGLAGVDLVGVDGAIFVNVPLDMLQFGFTASDFITDS